MSENESSAELNFKTGPASELTKQLMDYVGSIEATKVFVSGYSSPTEKRPDGSKKVYDYSLSLSAVLEGTARNSGNVAYITSPTTSPDSVDAIATTAGIKFGKGAILFTALEYAAYVKPDELLALNDAQRETFKQTPKFMFEGADDYSKTSAQACDTMVVAGGRNVAITDFANAVEAGKRIVILNNKALPAADDWEKNGDGPPKRPNNASSFLIEKISSFLDGRQSSLDGLKDMGLSKPWLEKHREQLQAIISQNVISFDPAVPESVQMAADRLSEKVSASPNIKVEARQRPAQARRPTP